MLSGFAVIARRRKRGAPSSAVLTSRGACAGMAALGRAAVVSCDGASAARATCADSEDAAKLRASEDTNAGMRFIDGSPFRFRAWDAGEGRRAMDPRVLGTQLRPESMGQRAGGARRRAPSSRATVQAARLNLPL